MTKTTITSERRLVTPEEATKWLENNTHNRSISQTKVEQYAADMKAKKWDLNGEPIIFDWNEVLQDGQHRLWACVESLSTFETMIVRGVDPATFKTIDTGKARSGGDVLSIRGYTQSNVLAATARLVIEYRAKSALSNMTHSRISNADVLDFVDKNKDLHKWVVMTRNHTLTKKFASLLAAVAYIGSHRHAAKAEEFIQQFGHGDRLPIGSPVLMLRNRLLADHRLKREERFGLIVLSWNAYVTGRSLLKTQLPRSSECPKIAGAEKL